MDAHRDPYAEDYTRIGPSDDECEKALRANWAFIKEALDGDGDWHEALAKAFLAGDLNGARPAIQKAINAEVERVAKRHDYDWPLIAEAWDDMRREEEAPDDKTRVLQLIASVNPNNCAPDTLQTVVDVAREGLAVDIARPLNPIGDDAE